MKKLVMAFICFNMLAGFSALYAMDPFANESPYERCIREITGEMEESLRVAKNEAERERARAIFKAKKFGCAKHGGMISLI